jgi:hypothetical protein
MPGHDGDRTSDNEAAVGSAARGIVTQALVAGSMTGVLIASVLLWFGYALAALAAYLLTVVALAGTIFCLIGRGLRA